MFFGNKIIIGLDIGADSIKMVEINKTPGTNEISTYGIARHGLQLDGYWNGTILRQLTKIIHEIMEHGNFDGVKTVISVPSKNIYVTTTDFDANFSDAQIRKEIEKQAPYFLPFPIDEMKISISIVDTDENLMKITGKKRAVINGLPNFVIENNRNLLEHLNLDGVALENQTKSQIRSCLQGDKEKTVIVDVGAFQTTFSIIINGTLRSSHHINTGSHKITQSLSKSLGIDDTVAEDFKKDLNLINLFALPKEVMDFLIILKTELNMFVELNRRVNQNPAKIIFTGGGANIAGLASYFKTYPVPVYFGDSLANVVFQPEYTPYLTPISHQLSTAIGLALRDDV